MSEHTFRSRRVATTAADKARRVREEQKTGLIGPVEVGPIAHGGHCVARHDGRVIFVRHALPGERVLVQVTDESHARFWRGDAVQVLEPSPDRVRAPCPIAGPGLCGGCDFQHVDLPAQRRLKASVVAEQLRRLAGIDWAGEVEPVSSPGTEDGLAWRTRMRYTLDADGRPGLRAHRSHRVIALPPGGCRIAAPGALDGSEGTVTEVAAGRRWAVAADGFWQVHPAAADTLAAAVRRRTAARAGGACLRPVLRCRPVRRRARRLGLPGLGCGEQQDRGRSRPDEPGRRRGPGGRSSPAGWNPASGGCRVPWTWWCWTRRVRAPAPR